MLFIVITAGVWTVPTVASGEVVPFQQVLQQALAQNYDLKIANLDTKISETLITKARAEYYPIIKTQLNSEYLKDLTHGPETVTTVGSTVLPVGSRYQNSVGLTLNQTLFDFGVRHYKVDMAKKDMAAKEAAYDQTRRDLTLKVIDAYADALNAFHAMHNKMTILPVFHEIYDMKKRLYDAGNVSKLEVAEEALNVAQTMSELQTLQDNYMTKLTDLSHYTRQTYDPLKTELSDFSTVNALYVLGFDPQRTPDARAFNQQIAAKAAEIEVQKRQALPQLYWYSSYMLYGFDPKSPAQSIGNIRNRMISVGLSISIPMFDGFKNRAEVKRLSYELEKLQLQRDKALADLQHQYQTFHNDTQAAQVELQVRGKLVGEAEAKVTMSNRLTTQQLLQRTELLKAQAAWLSKQLDTEQADIKRLTALTKIQVLNQYE